MTIKPSLLFFVFLISPILFGQNLNFAVSEIDESLFKNANAIVRIDETIVDHSTK